jgi:hypothetical protein
MYIFLSMRRWSLAGSRCAVLPGPRRRWFRTVRRPVGDFVFLVRLLVRRAWLSMQSLALCRVCAIAPSLVYGWQAFSSVSIHKNMFSVVAAGMAIHEYPDLLRCKTRRLSCTYLLQTGQDHNA